jgi:hypothetical protein
MGSMVVYLIKDNDELCCHCSCDDAYITFPPQMDCPWCGCGWLFTCIQCRKAFTFARAVEVPDTWEQLACRDLAGRWSTEPKSEDISGWVAAMKALLAHVEMGKQYVCLDGLFIPTDAACVDFEGWHARHRLDFVPQVAALDDYFVSENILNNRLYWTMNALPRDE